MKTFAEDVDKIAEQLYGIRITEMISRDEVMAHSDGLTPEAWVLRFGEKYGLVSLDDF